MKISGERYSQSEEEESPGVCWCFDGRSSSRSDEKLVRLREGRGVRAGMNRVAGRGGESRSDCKGISMRVSVGGLPGGVGEAEPGKVVGMSESGLEYSTSSVSLNTNRISS